MTWNHSNAPWQGRHIYPCRSVHEVVFQTAKIRIAPNVNRNDVDLRHILQDPSLAKLQLSYI